MESRIGGGGHKSVQIAANSPLLNVPIKQEL